MSIIAAGTTTTTALSSTGNTDGTLQLQVNGTTPSVTLNTLGAIGVGSTPNYGTSGQALVSAGSTAAPTWANVTTSPAGSNTQIQYNNSGSFGASSALTFDGTNLGVGATTVATRVDIVGGADNQFRLSSNETNATTKEGKFLLRHYTNAQPNFLVMYPYSTSTDNAIYYGGGSSAQTAATFHVWMTAANNTTVSGTEQMRLTSTGLGIGTSSPANPTGGKGFEISNASGASIRATNSATYLDLQSGSSANYILSNGAYPLLFYTNSAERFRIGPAGQLGIGGATYGTSGQVLTSGGSGAAPSWTTIGGSAMVRLDTQTVSGVSAVNMDFISSTYTNYLLIFEGIFNSAAGSQPLRVRYRCSGTTDTGTAYSSVYNQSTGSAISGGSAASDTSISLNPNSPSVYNNATAIFGVINISTFLNNSGGSYIIRSQAYLQNPTNGGGSPFGGFPYTNWVSGGYQGSSSLNSAVTGINLTFNSGGVTGKVTLYGLT